MVRLGEDERHYFQDFVDKWVGLVRLRTLFSKYFINMIRFSQVEDTEVPYPVLALKHFWVLQTIIQSLKMLAPIVHIQITKGARVQKSKFRVSK